MSASAAPMLTDEWTGRVHILVPAVPPSLNQVGSRGSRWRYIKAKRQWEDMLWPLLHASGLPQGCSKVHAFARLVFPVARRRDAGNYGWMLEKALGDVLVKRTYLADDTPEFYVYGPTLFESFTGDAQTTLFINFLHV